MTQQARATTPADSTTDPALDRLKERARLIQVLQLTEQALMTAVDVAEHNKVLDLFLEAMRELEDLLDANYRASLTPEPKPASAQA